MDQGPAARQLLKDFVAGTSTEAESKAEKETQKVTSNWKFQLFIDFVFEY